MYRCVCLCVYVSIFPKRPSKHTPIEINLIISIHTEPSNTHTQTPTNQNPPTKTARPPRGPASVGLPARHLASKDLLLRR